MTSINDEAYYESIVEISKTHVHELKLSTVTMTCKLSSDQIDLSMIDDYHKNKYDKNDITIKYSNIRGTFELTKRGKIKKQFFNQLTINYKDTSKKSIKIFTNGRIHITGIHSFADIHNVPIYIKDWLQKSLNEEVTIIQNQICMMNFILTINKSLNLEYFCQLINSIKIQLQNRITTLSYEPQTYPGINLKIQNEYYDTPETNMDKKKEITFLIFKSGKVIITGCKNIQNLDDSYKFFIKLLEFYQ